MNALWASRKLEEGALVCDLRLPPFRETMRRAGVSHYSRAGSIDTSNNWALTDGLSLWLLGASIANDPALIAKLDAVDALEKSMETPRRGCLSGPSAKRGAAHPRNFPHRHAADPDQDDMVQKGVGWLLKETYPKKPAEVVRFLLPVARKAPRLTLRYAAEKMTPADEARVLLIPLNPAEPPDLSPARASPAWSRASPDDAGPARARPTAPARIAAPSFADEEFPDPAS